MEKIKTIFDRDWKGNRKVINKFIDGFNIEDLEGAIATEKLDGMNVRTTIRNGIMVRLEKRRNPTKLQKAQGIIDPWYVDADEFGKEDKWLFDAVKNTDFSKLPNGEWSGEAIGKKIQGNPLNLDNNRIMFFME